MQLANPYGVNHSYGNDYLDKNGNWRNISNAEERSSKSKTR